jgi:hypothetical protein
MMTKSDIISAALDELLERFHSNPEAFDYTKALMSEGEYIVWRTIINSSNQTIYDPTSQQRTVIVTFDANDNLMSVRIYNQCNLSNSMLHGITPDANIESKKIFKGLRRNYRKFRKLRELILNEQAHKEAKSFLKKLSSAFPSLLDKHIFGK